ncbi:MAG: hypothetical protein K0R76_208 [Alphaproteobacteria bacterium]|jgi:hypothetical protein|nr:hypothetical protein [Alphaproteobacteria bacterium]
MKGMTILDDMVLEQIVGGHVGGGGGGEVFLLNASSDKGMEVNSHAARGLITVDYTENAPFILGF